MLSTNSVKTLLNNKKKRVSYSPGPNCSKGEQLVQSCSKGLHAKPIWPATHKLWKNKSVLFIHIRPYFQVPLINVKGLSDLARFVNNATTRLIAQWSYLSILLYHKNSSQDLKKALRIKWLSLTSLPLFTKSFLSYDLWNIFRTVSKTALLTCLIFQQ